MANTATPLFSPEGAAVLANVMKPALQASTLPAEAYWSPAVYEREMERIFRKEWICVGRREDVPNTGDYFTTTLAGEPLIVARDESGEIGAFLNVCRHRGCEVVQGAGNAERFRCPYHGWLYGLNGELKTTPNFAGVENFDKSKHALHAVKAEVWEGFIFVNLDRDAEPFAPRVSEMSRWQFEKYGFGDKEVTHSFSYDIAANWKTYVENGMEEYHTPWVHAETLQPFMPMLGWKELTDVSDQPWTVMIGQFPGISMSPTGKSLLPIPDSFKDIDPQFDGMPIANIFPNFLIVATPDSMSYIMVEPTGPETTRVTIRMCLPKEVAAAFRAGDPEATKIAEAYAETIPPFMAEDNMTAEAQQRGLRSKLASSGRYCKYEQLAWRFVNWVARKAYI